MYRIKLGSGDESVFNSFEELSFGIGTGIIGPDAQIYHDRAEKWLPVTVHPAYKKAIAGMPPPDPDAAAAPVAGSNGASVPAAEPAKNEVDEGGQDLMTLLNLGELAEFDPRKVQESAATQDPAEPPEDQAEPAPEASLEPGQPEPEESESVDLPVASDEEFSRPRGAEGVAAADLEFISVPEDEETEDETGAGDEDEPETTDLSEILDDSAAPDDLSTQALDSVMEEPSVAVSDEHVPVVDEAEVLDYEEEVDGAEDRQETLGQGMAEDVVESELEEETEDNDSEAVAEPVMEEEGPDKDAEDFEEELEEAESEPPSGEAWRETLSETDDTESDEEEEEETEGEDSEAAAEPVMEEEPEEDEEDFEEELEEPEPQPSSVEAWDGALSETDDTDSDVEQEGVEEEDADERFVPAVANAVVEDDPITAFDPHAEDLVADTSPALSGRLPRSNRKPLVAVAIAAGVVILGGLAWMLKGTVSAQGGDDPVQTPVVAAAGGGATIPAPATPPAGGGGAAVPDSAITDTAPDAQVLQQQYEEAYARAQVRFDDALRRAGFVRVFAARRFATASDMAAVRSAARNARRALGDYSVREGTIESSYAEADPSLRETRANRELAEDLLAVTDSMYGLLLGNLESFAVRAGAMTITGGAIEAEYVRLRDEVDRLVILASEVENGTQSTSLSRIAAGIGTTRPLPISTLAPAPAVPDLAPVTPNQP